MTRGLGLFLCLILLVASLVTRPVAAENAASIADVILAEAVRLQGESQGKDTATQLAAARDILQLFDLIVAGYPQSLPAQAILAGGQVGPIDLPAVQAMAGVTPGASPAAAPGAVSLTGLLDAMEGLVPVVPRLRVPPWHRRLVAGAVLTGGYAHGQFPSQGQRTHPGIDLIASCGATVVSPWAGTVERVSTPDSPDFAQLGNAVMVSYPIGAPDPDEDPDAPPKATIHAAFLGLGAPPVVAAGDKIRPGQRLGVTGPLHDLDSCGVHLEIRTFPAVDHGILPLWNRPLAIGDWRAEAEFREGWHDPDLWVPWFDSLQDQPEEAPIRLAGQDWVTFYSKTGPRGEPIEQNLWSKPVADIFLSARVSVTVNLDSSLDIVLTKVSDAPSGGKRSALLRGRTSDDFFLGVRFLKDGKVLTGVSRPARLVLDKNQDARLDSDVSLSLSPDYLARQPDSIQFVLLGDAVEEAYDLGAMSTDLLFHAAQSVDPSETMLRDLRDLAAKVSACLPWTLPDGVLLTVPVRAAAGRIDLAPGARIAVAAEGPQDDGAAGVYARTLPAMLAACPGIAVTDKAGLADGLTDVDLVLGWPVQ